ncbi:AAA family ATPase [Candidatus Saccharibacteria bacterium]|nr:AAA family ATPase [Candidatus Saccharibacteria bacterium]
MTNDNVKMIAFVGMTGVGKSAAADYLRKKGVPDVYLGGVVLKEMERAGYDRTAELERKFREDLRRREGKDFVAQRAVEQLRGLIGAGQKRIVIDGIYSWTEYRTLKREFPGSIVTVALVMPKKKRHGRLKRRDGEALVLEEAKMRDWSEIEELEKGGPIADADHFVVSSDDEEETFRAIDEVLTEVGFFG